MSPAPSEHHPASHWATLAIGIVAISFGSILIRLASAPALSVATWRMVLASLVLAPLAWPKLARERHLLSRRDVVLLVLAALSLAVHMASWVTSLSYTTVASSVILVQTNPIFVGLASHLLLSEKMSRRAVVAIALTMVGTIIISYGDLAISGRALLGDALALIGAIAGSAYILLGRAVRRKLSTMAYIWPCYGLAGLALLALSLVLRQPLLGFDTGTYLALLGLALVPQIIGHSVFNWALAHFSAIFVTLALLGEPIGATILALLIFSEIPALTAAIGGPLIMLGILLASREEQRAASGSA